MASITTPKVATWQTVNGEFTQGSFSPFDSIEEAKVVINMLNADLGEGSPFHWHIAELNELNL